MSVGAVTTDDISQRLILLGRRGSLFSTVAAYKSIFDDITFRRAEDERFTYKSFDYGWLIDKKKDDEPDWMKKYPKKKQVPAYLLKLVERIDVAADKGFEARRKLLAESDFS